MTRKFLSRKTKSNIQQLTGSFASRPFATPQSQLVAPAENFAAPTIQRLSGNSDRLSRIDFTQPEAFTPRLRVQRTEPAEVAQENLGIEGEAIQRSSSSKNWLEKVSILPPEPPSTPGFPIQAKLTVGAVGDKYEQEADWVACQVVNRIQAPQVNFQSSQSNSVQHKISRQGLGRESGAVSRDWESKVSQARGRGEPLSASLKEPMEGKFGADFSGALAPRTSFVTLTDKISTDRADGSKIARFSTGNNEEDLSCNPDSYLEKIADEVKNTINRVDLVISAYETIKEAIKKVNKARGLAKLSSMEIARGAATTLSGLTPGLAAIDATIAATVGLSKGIAYLTWKISHPERVNELMESFDDVPTDLLGLIFAPSKSITLARDLRNTVKMVRRSLKNLKQAKNIQETLKSLYELREAVKATIDVANQVLKIDRIKKFVEENVQPALQQIDKTIDVVLEYNPSLNSSIKEETKDEGDAAYSPFQSVVESIKGSSFGQYF